MHGLKTLVGMNRRNAEAERIMREFAQHDGRTIPETQDRTANTEEKEQAPH